ncbi:MAG: hypothetical protein WCX61_00380 [Candidatus Peribacteraceae bacterium]|jgi:starch synthase
MTPASPATDKAIAFRYNEKTLEQKVKNKTELQKELGWPAEPKRMMLCLPAGMTDALGGALLEEVLPGLLALPMEILILGQGSTKYGTLFTQLAKEHGHRIAIVPNNKPAALRAMYAASDAALFFADPSQLPALAECMRYGVVPIAPACEALQNYDPVQESGTSFLYEEPSVWQCFAAIVRAQETNKFPFDWRTIQKHCMTSM